MSSRENELKQASVEVCPVEADQELARRVSNYLVGRQMPGLRTIKVHAHGDTITLRGRVSSFYEKQLCLNCTRRVAGVRRLVDLVDVRLDQASGLA